MANTRSPPSSSRDTSWVESSTRLAFWVQTFTQFPQATHSSAMTVACPAMTLMALAGHSRTHV